MPGFLPWMLLRRPPLLAQCFDLHVHLYYTAVQNLVYGCGNVPQDIAESTDTLPVHCAQHVQQPIDMSFQLPAGLQFDPVQMAELRQQVLRVLGFLPCMRPPLLAKCVDLDARLKYTVVQNLVYGCGNVPQKRIRGRQVTKK